MMDRRLAIALLSGGWAQAPLWAAEVWTKDPASWDEKDLAKLLSDSPWAQKVQLAFGGGAGGGMPGGGGMGGGMGGGGDEGGGGGLSGPGGGPGGGMGGGGGGMGGGGGGRRGGGGGMGGGGGGVQPMTYIVRWMSALPLKHAIVRARMGKEADTSPQAKEFLERQETHYAVALIGPARGVGMGAGREGKQGEGKQDASPEERMQRMAGQLKEVTGLMRKGKEPIRPETVQMPQPGQGNYLFLFPRADAITVDDKEVEFATRLGPFEVKRKFKLKDMVFNGQLSL